MSLEEIKTAATELPEKERLWLAAYLLHLSRVDSRSYAEELTAINKRIDAGHYATLDDLKKLHAELEAEGL